MNTGGAAGTTLETLNAYKSKHNVSVPPTSATDVLQLLNDYHEVVDTMITIIQGQQRRLDAIELK